MEGKRMLTDDQLAQVTGGFVENKSSIEIKVIRIIAECLDVDVNSVNLYSNLVSDLDADGLDMIDIMKELENAFDIRFNESTVSSFVTVGDIVWKIECDFKSFSK